MYYKKNKIVIFLLIFTLPMLVGTGYCIYLINKKQDSEFIIGNFELHGNNSLVQGHINGKRIEKIRILIRKNKLRIDTLKIQQFIDDSSIIYENIRRCMDNIQQESGGRNYMGLFENPYEYTITQEKMYGKDFWDGGFAKIVEQNNQFLIKYAKIMNAEGIPFTVEYPEGEVLMPIKLGHSNYVDLHKYNEDLRTRVKEANMITALLLLQQQEFRLFYIETELLEALENKIFEEIAKK